MKCLIVMILMFSSLHIQGKESYSEHKRALEASARALYSMYDLEELVHLIVHMSNRSVYSNFSERNFSLVKTRYSYHKNKIQEDSDGVVYNYFNTDLASVLETIDSVNNLVDDNFGRLKIYKDSFAQKRKDVEKDSLNQLANGEIYPDTVIRAEIVVVLENSINPLCSNGYIGLMVPVITVLWCHF